MKSRTHILKTGLLLGTFCVLGLIPPVCAQIKLVPRASRIDAKARVVLDRMVEAYRKIPTVSLKTEFFSELIPIDKDGNPVKIEVAPPVEKTESSSPPVQESPEKSPPDKNPSRQKMPRSLRLYFTRPNRIRLEMQETASEIQKAQLYQWVSDGKFFYSTIPEKNYYTKEKAPRKFSEFFHLYHMNFSSWDVLLLAGVDVFAELMGTMDSVVLEGTESVQGVATDIVRMEWLSPTQEITYRFYVGKEDSLLRRVVQETRDMSGAKEPGKVGGGDPFDQLSDIVQPTQAVDTPGEEGDVPLLPPAPIVKLPRSFKTRMTYEYTVNSRPDFAADTFDFTSPAGAFLYGDVAKKRLKLKDYRALAKSVLAQRKP